MDDDEARALEHARHWDPRIVAWMTQRGMAEPTPIQALAWPELNLGGDALLVAPTGTGKTEAALLPLVAQILSHPRRPVAILYVTPLRALNRDLEGRLRSLATAAGLTAAVRHGDTPTAERNRQSKSPPDILITTPETLQLLLAGKNLRVGISNLQAVIVDELHELAASDRGAQLAVSLERLDDLAGRPLRRVGLSATVGNPTELAEILAPRDPRPRVIQAPCDKRFEISVRPSAASAAEIPPDLVRDLKADDALLRALLAVVQEIRAHKATLVFVNTRPTGESLAARIRRMAPDLPLAVHHGSLSRQVREDAEEAFRTGQLRALIATSSLELGIDIGVADHVVQFGSPHQAARLLQRVGRSGHRREALSSGTVVALDDEDLEEAAVLGRRALAGEVEAIRVRRRNRLALAQQVIASLRVEGDLPQAETLRRLRRAVAVRDLTDLEVDDLLALLEGLGTVRRRAGHLARGSRTLERFYATLSLIPEERTYPLRDIGSRGLIGTLDERFVVTQVLARPDFTFLLHGSTWRVVEFRDEELLVEAVQEIGAEPRWVGEDIPVPFDVAQEIGRWRRTGDQSVYLLSQEGAARLVARHEKFSGLPAVPTDQTITLEMHGRLAVLGTCFGTQVNTTLATMLAGLATSRFGGRTDVLLVEPTWIALGLPETVRAEELRELLKVEPETVPATLTRLVPGGQEYRWTFAVVARKLGLLPIGADARSLRTLEPLLETHRDTPLGEEALAKTLHERFDVVTTQQVMERIRDGQIRLEVVAPLPGSLGSDVLERLKWQQMGGTPPPTLLRAVRDRLAKEPLLLICLRCGFQRTVTPSSYAAAGGSQCRVCKGALSAVLSPRREEDARLLVKYIKARARHPTARRPVSPALKKIVEAAYTSAELVASYGGRALTALAARGVGPDKARRLLSRIYRSEDELLGELLKAERAYAETRAFWD